MVRALLQFFNATTFTQRKIFWIIVTHLFFAIVAYGFFVNATILNIVERRDIQQELRTLVSVTGELESRYNSLRNRISYEEAYALGFSDPGRQIYAARSKLVRNTNVIY